MTLSRATYRSKTCCYFTLVTLKHFIGNWNRCSHSMCSRRLFHRHLESITLYFCTCIFRFMSLYFAGGVFNLKAIYALLLIPEVLYIVIVKTVVGVPNGVFHSMFTIVNMDQFKLTPRTNGYLLTYIGIITAVSHYSLHHQRQYPIHELCNLVIRH